ncbi:MAG: hypothetical protein FWC51_04025 [Proteobacteria bacterium]|nr:hypothetical protein [Pseudomonadota bacterium]
MKNIIIENKFARAEISPVGATIVSFKQTDGYDLFWTSPLAKFDGSRDIRGGAPICWPRFAQDEVNSHLPKHGFARTSIFNLDGIIEQKDQTIVKMSLPACKDFPANLEIEFSIKHILGITMTTTNTIKSPLMFTSAIHSYFKINDIDNIKIGGLDNGYDLASEKGQVFGYKKPVVIKDEDRDIRIANSNFSDIIVWNPRTKASADIPGDSWREFICVESGNVQSNVIKLHDSQRAKIEIAILNKKMSVEHI